MSKVVLFLTVVSLTVDSYYCWFTDINTKMLNQDPIYNNVYKEFLTSVGTNRGILIFPRTKWCGSGNVANNYDDLGKASEADTCCREHDHCADLIEGGGTKYTLTNHAFYTRLHCSCETKFLKCLRAANTNTARYIGVIYFNLMHTKCFRKDYPVKWCVKKGGWFKTKCVTYSYNTHKDQVYQWFDVPDFYSSIVN